MHKPAVPAFVGLGANLGDARASLLAAVEALRVLPQTGEVQLSSFYRSAPIEAHGPDFVNAVAQLSTSLSAEELLAHLQRIEAAHGRERPYRNAPRTLDLDLLLYGDRQIDTPELTVPHPRMHERAFVLLPLAELAGDGHVIPGRGAIATLLPGVAAQPISKMPIGSNQR